VTNYGIKVLYYMPKGRVGLDDSLRGRALCYAIQYSLGVLVQNMQKFGYLQIVLMSSPNTGV